MTSKSFHHVGKRLFLVLIIVSPWVHITMSLSALGMMAQATANKGSQNKFDMNQLARQRERLILNDHMPAGGKLSVDNANLSIAGGKESANKSTQKTVVNEYQIDASKILPLIEEARKVRDGGAALESLRILGLAKKIVEASSEEEFVKRFISTPIKISEYNSLMMLGRYKDAQAAIEGVIQWIETPEVMQLIREDSRFLGNSPYSAYYKAAMASKYIDARRASEYLDKGFKLLEHSANKNQKISEDIYMDYAQLYEQLGHYNKAISVYSMMGYLYMGAKGYAESPGYAGLLDRLANLYMILGNNGYAELLIQGAIRIYKNNHKTHLRELQWSQIGLLKLREKLEEAIALARQIEDRAYQENNKGEVLRALGAQIQYAHRMDNSIMLQQLFHRFGSLPKSVIDEGGKEDPGAILLISIPLSERLLTRGKIYEAKQVIAKALDSSSQELGPESFLTIKALLTLARAEEELDEKKAINMYRNLAVLSYDKSLAIQAIESLSRLSYLEAKGGDFQAAILAGRAHSAAFLMFLHDTLPGLPMKERVRTVESFSSDILHTLSASHPGAVEAGLWAAINERGLLDHIELSQRKAARDKRQTKIFSRLEDLASLESSGRVLYGADQKDESRNLYLLRNQLTPYKEARRFIEPKELLSVLPERSIYVHVVKYLKHEYPANRAPLWHYGAYISDTQGSSFVEMGEARDIDTVIGEALFSLRENLADSKHRLYKVYTRAVLPLFRHIHKGSQVFISLDSEMNTMPLGALYVADKGDRTLADDYKIRIVSAPRDYVLSPASKVPARRSAPVVFANPVYPKVAVAKNRGAQGDGGNMPNNAMSRMWAPLAYAGAEGAAISSIINAKLFAQEKATKANLKAVKSPIILHIAAHAFFDPIPSQGTSTLAPNGEEVSAYRRLEHYLSGSGIALSGPMSASNISHNDQILTAAEASYLGLNASELVVLSGCSTGEGIVTNGLGVYGLHRSFIEAGVKSALISLWQVDDQSTAEFMQRFYHRLKAGDGRSDALAAVQEEFRTGKVQSPSGTNWKEPYYWAAWQLVGDWRPIKGL